MAIKRAMRNAEYEKLDTASILTMKHYFKDPEWFDSGLMRGENVSEGHRISGKVIQPKRCDKCSRVYQKSIRVDKYHPNITYLNTGLFKGIPLPKETCNECK